MVGAQIALRGGLRRIASRGGLGSPLQQQQQARISVTRLACRAQGFSKEIVTEGTGAQPTKGKKVRLSIAPGHVLDILA